MPRGVDPRFLQLSRIQSDVSKSRWRLADTHSSSLSSSSLESGGSLRGGGSERLGSACRHDAAHAISLNRRGGFTIGFTCEWIRVRRMVSTAPRAPRRARHNNLEIIRDGAHQRQACLLM